MKWINKSDEYDGSNVYVCSNCGLEWYLEEGTPEENDMNYCPKCGEKSDEFDELPRKEDKQMDGD